MFAGAIFINQSLKLNLYVSIIILLTVACVFTATGGLTAVIWTDAVQTVIMLIGGITLMVISESDLNSTLPNVKSVRFSRYLAISRATCGRALHDSGKSAAELVAMTGDD